MAAAPKPAPDPFRIRSVGPITVVTEGDTGRTGGAGAGTIAVRPGNLELCYSFRSKSYIRRRLSRLHFRLSQWPDRAACRLPSSDRFPRNRLAQVCALGTDASRCPARRSRRVRHEHAGTDLGRHDDRRRRRRHVPRSGTARCRSDHPGSDLPAAEGARRRAGAHARPRRPHRRRAIRDAVYRRPGLRHAAHAGAGRTEAAWNMASTWRARG